MEICIRIQPQNPKEEDIYFLNKTCIEDLTEQQEISKRVLFAKEGEEVTHKTALLTVYKQGNYYLVKCPSKTKDYYNRALNIWILVLNYENTECDTLIDIVKHSIAYVKFEVPQNYISNICKHLNHLELRQEKTIKKRKRFFFA